MSPSESIPPQLNPALLESYKNFLNSSMQDKLAHFLPFLGRALESRSLIVSLGAGTGKLEAFLAKLSLGKVVAIDYNLQMIEDLEEEAENLAAQLPGERLHLLPVSASAAYLPLKSGSADSVIACSVLHEIISFADHYRPAEHTGLVLGEAARVLKTGGSLIVRDFMLPPNYRQKVIVEIGKPRSREEMDPVQFVHQFLQDYQGSDLPTLRKLFPQREEVKAGWRFEVPLAEALELLVHHSWSKRFAEEVKEQYFYFSAPDYARVMARCFQESGFPAKIIHASAYLQPGYPEHLNNRFNLYTPKGEPLPLPPITGVVVLEKR